MTLSFLQKCLCVWNRFSGVSRSSLAPRRVDGGRLTDCETSVLFAPAQGNVLPKPDELPTKRPASATPPPLSIGLSVCPRARAGGSALPEPLECLTLPLSVAFNLRCASNRSVACAGGLSQALQHTHTHTRSTHHSLLASTTHCIPRTAFSQPRPAR